ncbi:ATP-binding protein [Streptomyces sp. NPDC007063]|uniref:ATP-binding protein n=1 Tax=Streptomyces sp. NPDC007063 TaxID=3364772 RepID=UPI003697CB5A
MPRPEAQPGIWRAGHTPPRPEEPDPTPTRQLVVGALATALLAWVVSGMLWQGYLGDYWLWPYLAIFPKSVRGDLWWQLGTWPYSLGVVGGIIAFFARLGRWPELGRRIWRRLQQPPRPAGAPPLPASVPPPPPETDPVQWPHLRAAGLTAAADRLRDELHAGKMTDVDHARIGQAWQSSRTHPAAFSDTVLQEGAQAFCHPGGRDLPGRAALHDLVLRQVRIGTAVDTEQNPREYRGAGIALDPATVGTSLLTVGPPGSGKTMRLARPVIEAGCVQALAGQAAVVAVTAAGAGKLGPEEQFDVIVRPGQQTTHGLDLYGGTDDPDIAAGMLAEALVGDLTASQPDADSSRAAIYLGQLLGPHRAAYSRFPTVPELRALLDGDDAALKALRYALDGDDGQLRELEAFVRQTARGGEMPALMGERIALLDRPAFAATFAQGTAGDGLRLLSLQAALERPVRVRIDLPERGHPAAARILARLVLAQFTECVTARADQSLFALLVLDDAAGTVTPYALDGLRRLWSTHAGVTLSLRGLDDVPEHLRGPLLGAVGCRVVCAGVTPWDAARFADVWGTEWVETRTVSHRELVSDEPVTRVLHAVRRLVTGKRVTAESVTVQREQRQRWSASDLSSHVPAGHAVLSVTTTQGVRTSPVLTDLRV